MKRPLFLFQFFLSLLFAAAPEQARVAPAGAELALRPVDLHRVEAGELRARAEVSGVLEGRRDATLFSETRGPVLDLGAEELDAVVAGQVLLRIDPLQAEVAVERARAVLARRKREMLAKLATAEEDVETHEAKPVLPANW